MPSSEWRLMLTWWNCTKMQLECYQPSAWFASFCIELSNVFRNTSDCQNPTLNLRFQRGGQKASTAREDLQILQVPSPNEEELCCLAFNKKQMVELVDKKVELVDKIKPAPTQGSDDEDGVEADFCLDGERIEDDETLRLHILGSTSSFAKFLSLGFGIVWNDLVCSVRTMFNTTGLTWPGVFCRESRYIESNFAQRVAQLPTRYLPPGSVKMLWFECSQTIPGISCLC